MPRANLHLSMGSPVTFLFLLPGCASSRLFEKMDLPAPLRTGDPQGSCEQADWLELMRARATSRSDEYYDYGSEIASAEVPGYAVFKTALPERLKVNRLLTKMDEDDTDAVTRGVTRVNSATRLRCRFGRWR